MRRSTPGSGEGTQVASAPYDTTRWLKSALRWVVVAVAVAMIFTPSAGKLARIAPRRYYRVGAMTAVTAGLGLKAAGVTPGGRGEIPVDDHCRAGDGLWAIGDVTGISLFTHVAMYQGRVAADNILGRDRAATYHGIPRVIFADQIGRAHV